MKFFGLSCLLLTLSFNVFAKSRTDKVVYGVDDRKDIYESNNRLFKKLASSTAAMIPTGQVVPQKDTGMYEITGSTLMDDGICSNERFAKQMTSANCSGFLVGGQYLVTAGHCITELSDCSAYTWVFDFANLKSERKDFIVPAKDIYTCTEIIARALDRITQDDYALVKLDRVVEGREPLTFRKSGKVGDKADLVVIGHPSGLPSKIADGAYVRTNTNKVYFQANLDTFGGNSGSAVFDSKTGLVEGILVRGERDYEPHPSRNCERVKVCKTTECHGEDVTRITNIKELM